MGRAGASPILSFSLLILFFSLFGSVNDESLTIPQYEQESIENQSNVFFGFTEGRPSPIPMSVGSGLVCWIEYPNGDVFCLTSDEVFELDSQELLNKPHALELPEGIGKPISVSLGGGKICLLDSRNLLHCSNLQITNISVSNFGIYSSFYPVPIPGGPVVSISVGGKQSCSLTSSGSIWCWDNSYDNVNLIRPKELLIGREYAAISVISGEDTSCVILRDRSVYCWDQIQFSVEDTENEKTGVFLYGPIFSNKSSSLAIGDNFVCSMDINSEINCQEDGISGDKENSVNNSNPFSQINHSTPISISASDEIFCVVDS